MLEFKCQAAKAASARPCPAANYAGDVVELVTGETGFLRLASYDTSSQPFEGYLDELRVYGRVLDSLAVSKQAFAKLVPANEAGGSLITSTQLDVVDETIPRVCTSMNDHSAGTR